MPGKGIAQTAADVRRMLGIDEGKDAADEGERLRRAAPAPSWTKGGAVRCYVFDPDDGADDDR